MGGACQVTLPRFDFAGLSHHGLRAPDRPGVRPPVLVMRDKSPLVDELVRYLLSGAAPLDEGLAAWVCAASGARRDTCAVADAVVVGVPDELVGAISVAHMVRRPGRDRLTDS